MLYRNLMLTPLFLFGPTQVKFILCCGGRFVSAAGRYEYAGGSTRLVNLDQHSDHASITQQLSDAW